MMEIGWIIRFKDGKIEAMSELAYKSYPETSRRKNAEVKEHLFDISAGMKKYGI